MAVRALSEEDVEIYRDIRLRALAADPDAFSSTYDREVAFTAAEWRSRLTDSPERPSSVFLDEVDRRAVGTAGIAYTELDPAPMVVGMWVDPAARGVGSARRLLAATIAWATAQGSPEVVLWVVRDNERAIGLYRNAGFVPSGAAEKVPSNPCAEELEMRLALG